MFQKRYSFRPFIASGLFIFFVLFAGINQASAQLIRQLNSPYSIIGIGSKHDNLFSLNRAMGGISTGFRSPVNINYKNPASYSALNMATFEFGVSANTLWLNNGSEQQRSRNASLEYFALGMRFNKYWGAAIGLMPYSGYSYDILYKEDTDLGSFQNRFTGIGQLYQIFWGNGFKYKGFSAGFNLNYLFGTLQKENRSLLSDIDNGKWNYQTTTMLPKGFVFDLGTQYDFKIKKDIHLVAGLSGKLGSNIKTLKDEAWFGAQFNGDVTYVMDTVLLTEQEEGKLSLPAIYNAGLTLRNSSYWLVGVDISLYQWENYRNFGETEPALINSQRYALGLQFTPNPKTTRSFWQASNYRFGFYYDGGHLNIKDRKISAFALTGGIGIPIRRSVSRLNFSLEIGQRGTLASNLIRETFFNMTFGLTMNDNKWFIRRKYE